MELIPTIEASECVQHVEPHADHSIQEGRASAESFADLSVCAMGGGSGNVIPAESLVCGVAARRWGGVEDDRLVTSEGGNTLHDDEYSWIKGKMNEMKDLVDDQYSQQLMNLKSSPCRTAICTQLPQLMTTHLIV